MNLSRNLALALLTTLLGVASASGVRAGERSAEAQLSVSATVLSTCSIHSNVPVAAGQGQLGLALGCAAEARPLVATSAPQRLAYGNHVQEFVVTTVNF